MADNTDSNNEGRHRSASRRPSENPQAEDKESAFREIMKKQVCRLALTIKHTDVQKEELRDLLAPMCNYLRVGHEFHEEHVEDRPDDHLHAYLQLKSQKRLGDIYKLVQTNLDTRYYGRPDVRQLPSRTDAAKWNNYCKKEGDYIDHGELHVAGPAKQHNGKDEAPYHEFLRVAAADGVEAAMAYASESLVEHYCTRYTALREAAESKKPCKTKYELPSMKAEDVSLRPWQKAWLPRVMSRRPVARNIHWVWGSPGKGKSFAHDYLAANHPHGCFNAGNRCCLDNLVYNYDEEGVILWDFPMNFDWSNMALAAAAAIEKFSDFGTSLRSLKYKGKNCYARGHVVVFANRPPIEELRHREIIEFHIDDYAPPAIELEAQVAPLEEPVHLDLVRSSPAKNRKAKVIEQSEPETVIKPTKGTSKKRRQPPVHKVFRVESCEGNLNAELDYCNVKLEGGVASPKDLHPQSPRQAPPEASLPEGPDASDSETSTQTPVVSASFDANSEEATLGRSWTLGNPA